MIEIPKQVLDKLQKIMALANNEGATEGEAIAALGKARALLQQYDLSLDEFADLARDKSDTVTTDSAVFETATFSTWVDNMLHGIANITNTQYWYYKKSWNSEKGKATCKYYFVGHKSDIGMAACLASYMHFAAKGFADIYVDTNPKLKTASEKRLFRNSFYFGFGYRINQYAREIRESEKRKAEEEAARNNTERGVMVIWNALVLEKEKDIDKYKEEKNLKLKIKKTKVGINDPEGFQKGEETANTVLNNKPQGYIEN